MGSRGSKSATTVQGRGVSAPGQFLTTNGTQQNIANQAPTPQNTPVVQNAVGKLKDMSDDQLAALYTQSRSVDMPNHLSDVSDRTQKFVYAAGLNEKPMVVDRAGLNQYMKDNGISQSEVLSRSVGGADYTVNGTRIVLQPQQVNQMFRDSEMNYIGGKRGGQVYGAGTYFDMNGGRRTGYGSGSRNATMIGVLNKQKASIIDDTKLNTLAKKFEQKNPKFAKATGGYSSQTRSIYALAMGYNVIRARNGYHNIIGREAMVVLDSDI